MDISFTQWLEANDFKSFSINRPVVSGIQADKSRSGLGISTMGSRDRVARGKGVEEKIKSALAAHGIRIKPASDAQDMIEKIDGFWPDGKPVQIKYRDSGDDILFELIKPHRMNEPLKNQSPGRDMVGKAEYYLTLDRSGNIIYKIPTKLIKLLMQQTIRELGDRPLLRPYIGRTGVQLRPVKDPRDGTPKVNAFIPPALFDGISEKFPVSIAA